MQSWEDLWWLFTQPLFIALFLFSLILEPLLKYLRRFYPASMQEVIKKSENFEEELNKSEKDVKLMQKGHQYTGAIVFLPPSTVLSFYLLYTYFNGGELSPYLVKESIAFIFAPVMFIFVGVLTMNDEHIFKRLFQEDYPRYRELSKKFNGMDRFTDFMEKHKKVFGWFFVLLGLLAFFSFGGFIGSTDVS